MVEVVIVEMVMVEEVVMVDGEGGDGEGGDGGGGDGGGGDGGGGDGGGGDGGSGDSGSGDSGNGDGGGGDGGGGDGGSGDDGGSDIENTSDNSDLNPKDNTEEEHNTKNTVPPCTPSILDTTATETASSTQLPATPTVTETSPTDQPPPHSPPGNISLCLNGEERVEGETCITLSIGSDNSELNMEESSSPAFKGGRGSVCADGGGTRRVGQGNRTKHGREGGGDRRKRGSQGGGSREERDSKSRSGRSRKHKEKSSGRHEEREKQRKGSHRESLEESGRRSSASQSHRHREGRSTSHYSYHTNSRSKSSRSDYCSSEEDDHHRERESRRRKMKLWSEVRDSSYRSSREGRRERTPDPYMSREKNPRLRLYSDDYDGITPFRDSQQRSKESVTGHSPPHVSHRLHKGGERERNNHSSSSRHSRRRDTPDRDKTHRVEKRKKGKEKERDVRLVEELSSIEQQIREHKREILGTMLRSERLRLLHRNLRGEELLVPPSELMGVGGFPTVTGGAPPTGDVVSELEQLDQAIVDGKRQVLKLMKRMEERQAGIAEQLNTQ